MWPRILRLLTSLLNIYSFYANPVKYILSLLMVTLIPYLIYIFWGSIFILLLIGMGIYLLYRYFSKKKRPANYY